MANIPDDETLDALANAVLSGGGDIIITDMLNEWRYGGTTMWEVVREILRMAAEENAKARAIVG